MPKREIYLLSPRTLGAETIAVTFAKTSRAPESFREIASELSDQQSAQFHEKWVVGYGHASVAEHAVLHLAFENVSRVAIETIESSRLASYTEKSTRYQKWGRDDFTIPPELEGHALREDFMRTVRSLFKTYGEAMEPVRELVGRQAPRRENESEEAHDRRIRSQYVDSCRFILPAAANANVGMTANARVLEMLIRKMLSHPLSEVRQIGESVREAAKAEAPTLVKYADSVPYLIVTRQALSAAQGSLPDNSAQAAGWCRLVEYDKDGEGKVLAAALYRFGEMAFEEALASVQALDNEGRKALAGKILGGLKQHDTPLRELEYASYTFEIVMDQGAFAEFKRHRMMTQTPQLLSTRLGYTVPALLMEAGVGDKYQVAMEEAAWTYEKLRAFEPHVAQYVVPNGFNRRVLAQFNLREAFAFCQLRSAPKAHFSIRRVAEKIYEEITRVQPMLGQFMNLPGETWQDVEKNYFSKV